LPGVGFVPELQQELEKLKLDVWAPRPLKEATSYVLVKPTRRIAPGPAEFEEVMNRAIEDMKSAQRKEVFDRKVAEARARLAAGASFDSVAAALGGLKDSGLQGRLGAYLPTLGSEPRVIERAFGIKVGVASDTIQVAQGVVWVRPQERGRLEGASFTGEKDRIAGELYAANLGDWLERKKKTVKIEILRSDLREVLRPSGGASGGKK
jgi:hypothetical protein